MEWKTALIVNSQHANMLQSGIQALNRAGFEQVHVFAPRGVKVPTSEKIIRLRIEAETESGLWREALASMSGFASATDLFMIATPNLEYWEHFKLFVEATNEPDFVGVYLPYTPDGLWKDDASRQLSCAGDFGWCEQPVKSMTEADCCLVLNNRTLALLAFYLQQRVWAETNWSIVFSECVGRTHKLPAFFAKPSLARSVQNRDNLDVQSAAVDVNDLSKRNFYLPTSG